MCLWLCVCVLFAPLSCDSCCTISGSCLGGNICSLVSKNPDSSISTSTPKPSAATAWMATMFLCFYTHKWMCLMTSRFCFLCLINIYLKRLLVETTPQRNIIHTNSFTQLSALESLFRFSRAINFSVLAHSRYFHQPHFQQMFPADMLWQTLHMPSAKHQPVEKKKASIPIFFFTPTCCFWVPTCPSRWSCRG